MNFRTSEPKRWPFAGPSVLAPMEGVSHAEFRHMLVGGGGLHLVCTEFVRITRAQVTAQQIAREVNRSADCPLSVQVMGNEPERMAEAAGLVSKSGADVIDINLGCPMPRVVRKGVGAAMLKNPKLLHQVLATMRSATRGLLSAKIRAGFDDAGHALEIARLVEAAGADFIAVHPRRRADFYAGVADWRIIRQLKDELTIPVVGNGDVWYAADALRMQQETDCDAVMIGRPAIRNPWIFRQIEALRTGAPPFEPNGEAVYQHLGTVAERYGAAFPKRKRGIIGPLKEIVTWIGRSVNDDRNFQRRALRLETVDEILALARAELAPLTARDLDLDAFGRLGLEHSGSALQQPEHQVNASVLRPPQSLNAAKVS